MPRIRIAVLGYIALSFDGTVMQGGRKSLLEDSGIMLVSAWSIGAITTLVFRNGIQAFAVMQECQRIATPFTVIDVQTEKLAKLCETTILTSQE